MEKKLMLPHDQFITDFLKAIGAPPHVIAFTFKAGAKVLPEVTLTYHPESPNQPIAGPEDVARDREVTQRFNLVLVEEAPLEE